MEKKKGFLLSYIKYGDNDAILHCFTNNGGFESFYLRGIYTPKNKKKSFLKPLSELYLDVNIKRKSGALLLLNQIENVNPVVDQFNIKSSTILFFISDFLNQVLKNENAQSLVYLEIEAFVTELENNNFQAHLHFLFRIIQLLGFAPLAGNGSFLDIEMGLFVDHISHESFDAEISAIWKELLTSTKLYSDAIPQNKSREFLNSLLLYYTYHYDNFKTPVSLEIVKEIFQ